MNESTRIRNILPAQIQQVEETHDHGPETTQMRVHSPSACSFELTYDYSVLVLDPDD
jgi:hypothetical protein